MASAAEQLASNISLSSFAKATELKKRLWFTLGALVLFRFLSYVPIPGIDLPGTTDGPDDSPPVDSEGPAPTTGGPDDDQVRVIAARRLGYLGRRRQ